jgi:hypothetical protein
MYRLVKLVLDQHLISPHTHLSVTIATNLRSLIEGVLVMTTPPVEVQKYGQSIWYDNIERKLISSGELKRMIEEDGVLGVTSNPTIFEKAIGAGGDYDDAIKGVLDLEAPEIFERLAIDDILAALDLFMPESNDQDPCHARRHPRYRGSDCGGGERQRHADFLCQELYRGR